jgi:peptide/nickel transport system substrate-binding protein
LEIGAVAALVVIAATALGFALGFQQGVVGGPEFREGLVTARAPLSLDPLVDTSDLAVHDIGQLLYRRLFELDGRAYPRPDLVQTYSISRDGLTYRMALRPRQRWSDGTLITASDVAATFAFAQTSQLADHTMAALLHGVSVAINGPQLMFTLPAPRASFLATLTELPILPLGALAPAERSARESHPSVAMPTSGAYRVGATSASMLTLEGNRYASPEPKLGKAVFMLYPSFDAAARAFAAGTVDAVLATTPSQREQLLSVSGAVAHDITTFGFVDLLFNETVPGLDDAVVRHVISAAIDRGRILQLALDGADGMAEVGAISDGLPWVVTKDPQASTSVGAAAAALAQDGWQPAPDGVRARGDQSLSFTLSVPDAAPLPAVASEVRSQLMQIGIALTVRLVAPLSFVTASLDTHAFQLALGDWEAGPDPDVSTFWRSNAEPPLGFNVSGGAVDPFLDQALDDLAATSDPQARIAAANMVTADLASDAPAAFLYTPEVAYVVRATAVRVVVPAAGSSGARFADITNWTQS